MHEAETTSCPGCHARGQFTPAEILRLRVAGGGWVRCDVCRTAWTAAEWAVYNEVFPDRNSSRSSRG